MLKKVQQLDPHTFSIEFRIEGPQYEQAVSDYMVYIPKGYQSSYNHELFPDGQTPLAVNEEKHGDGVYRCILEKKFQAFYLKAIEAAKLNDVTLVNVELGKLCGEYIDVTAIVKDNLQADDDKKINAIIEEAVFNSSNIDKLVIPKTVQRDEFFWKDIADICEGFTRQISQEAMPLLANLRVLQLRNGKVYVDINQNSTSDKAMAALSELTVFSYAVMIAALHEYILDFSNEDNDNLKKYVLPTVIEFIGSAGDRFPDGRRCLTERLYEYYNACTDESPSGYSLYGLHGMDFDRLARWSLNHQAKCAHIFCDHIAYIKNFATIGSFEDLEKLKPITSKASAQEMQKYNALFNTVFPNVGAVLMCVRGALNGSRVMLWKKQGLCQHCGREFKRSFFSLKCPVCGIKKDY